MKIINITADGNFNALDLPRGYKNLKFQARTAVDMEVRFPGDSSSWTLKSGTTSADLPGQFGIRGLEVKAAAGTIIEVFLGGS